MKKIVLIVLPLIVLLTFGCQQRTVTQPDAGTMQDQDGSKSTEKITDTQIPLDQEKVTSSDQDRTRKYIEEKEGMFEDILFDYDAYDIKDEYKPVIKAVSEWMLKNHGFILSIEGHCDERGTNEYNLALGDRRAKAVKDYITSLGVSSPNLEIISYGEEKPVCTEQTEECWLRNRRVHFVVLERGK